MVLLEEILLSRFWNLVRIDVLLFYLSSCEKISLLLGILVSKFGIWGSLFCSDGNLSFNTSWV